MIGKIENTIYAIIMFVVLANIALTIYDWIWG